MPQNLQRKEWEKWYDFTKKAKRDKEGGIHRLRGSRNGKPVLPRRAAHGGGEDLNETKQKIGIQKHIRITDDETNKQIERIMTLPEYKSFNKVIGDALFYGLPILTEKLFGETKEKFDLPPKKVLQGNADEAYNATVVKLLKEIVLNEAINKSILSSVFHVLEYWSRQCDVPQEEYSAGRMSGTPEYLQTFEAMGIRNLRK